MSKFNESFKHPNKQLKNMLGGAIFSILFVVGISIYYSLSVLSQDILITAILFGLLSYDIVTIVVLFTKQTKNKKNQIENNHFLAELLVWGFNFILFITSSIIIIANT